LPYGLEAYAPLKHIRKEDNSLASPDETLTVKVIEFNRDDKRIMVSHLRYLEDIRREADEQVKQGREKDETQVRQQIKKQQSKIEKSTLGDLGIFEDIKEQLQENQDQAAEETTQDGE
jgi:small subunit ribosomal protein S1